MTRFYLALVVALCCLAPLTRAASPLVTPTAKPIILHYGIYGGGFQVLDAAVSFDLTPQAYTLRLQARPFGFWGKILPWTGDHRTTGMIAGGRLTPVRNDKLSIWHNDRDHLVSTYTQGELSQLQRIVDKNGVQKTETLKPDPEFYRGAGDTLTAIAQLLVQAGQANNCNFTQDVFDGKRRFALKFTDQGMEDLPHSTLNVFSGAAHKCQIEMVPEKGFDPKKPRGYYKIQETARGKGKLPVAWLTPLWVNGPTLPVRVRLDTDYGVVFVHLYKIER